MTDRPVRFAPGAKADIASLLRYIAQEASPDIAAEYVGELIAFCERLAVFPLRGTPREDLGPG